MVPEVPTFQFSRLGDQFVLTWSGNYQLFSATNVSGPYEAVSGGRFALHERHPRRASAVLQIKGSVKFVSLVDACCGKFLRSLTRRYAAEWVSPSVQDPADRTGPHQALVCEKSQGYG